MALLHHLTQIDTTSFVPEFIGTLTNMVRHHTGKLVPQSQSLASASGWDTFDITVPNPFADCYFEVAEYDIGFDDDCRIRSIISSYLAPTDQAGIIVQDFEIDYKTESGSYDGFEEWVSDNVEFRYLKARVHIQTALGVAIISGFTRIIEKFESSQKAESVAIEAAGTTITFPKPFHVNPFVEISILGSKPLMCSIDEKSPTQFTIYLSDVTDAISGSVDYKATGV